MSFYIQAEVDNTIETEVYPIAVKYIWSSTIYIPDPDFDIDRSIDPEKDNTSNDSTADIQNEDILDDQLSNLETEIKDAEKVLDMTDDTNLDEFEEFDIKKWLNERGQTRLIAGKIRKNAPKEIQTIQIQKEFSVPYSKRGLNKRGEILIEFS